MEEQMICQRASVKRESIWNNKRRIHRRSVEFWDSPDGGLITSVEACRA
jgi:hypothetical protein